MTPASVLMGMILMIDPWAKTVDFSGGVAFDLRGGIAPLQAGQPSEPTVRISISPTFVLTYRDRGRSREARLEYTPQAYYRLSQRYLEVSNVRRPLFFHQIRARYGSSLSPRWSWQGVGGATIGEADFSLQTSALGSGNQGDDPAGDPSNPGQPATAESPIVTTGGFTAGGGLTGRLTPLHSITIAPSVSIQRLLSGSEAASGFTYNQTSGDLSIAHGGTISQVDTITTTATGGYADFSTNGAQAYAAANVAWRRRLDTQLTSGLSGGVFFTQQVRSPQNNAVGGTALGLPLLPTINYSLSGAIHQRARLRITANINAGTQAYFDAVQGSVLPLAGGGFAFNFFLPPDINVGASASLYTPPTAPPEVEVNNPAAGRSSLNIGVPFSYRIDRNLSMESGFTFTGRGPHFSQIDAGGAFPVREYWLYTALRFSFAGTTGRSR